MMEIECLPRAFLFSASSRIKSSLLSVLPSTPCVSKNLMLFASSSSSLELLFPVLGVSSSTAARWPNLHREQLKSGKTHVVETHVSTIYQRGFRTKGRLDTHYKYLSAFCSIRMARALPQWKLMAMAPTSKASLSFAGFLN